LDTLWEAERRAPPQYGAKIIPNSYFQSILPDNYNETEVNVCLSKQPLKQKDLYNGLSAG
jgi:hypothetical protein